MDKQLFILEPRCGLCNQLNCIAIGIILGILYDRNIYFNGFQLDYMNENILTDFNKIINTNSLKELIKDYKITIIDNLENYDININEMPILFTENKLINNIKDIYSYLSSEINCKKNILNIKNPISTFIPDEYIKLFKNILLNIKFEDKFYKISLDIKEKFELDNYCCIHLRMEDDGIEFLENKLNNKNNKELINDITKQLYIHEIENLYKTGLKIFVCTSLCICENTNNLFYKIIKKKYNLIDKNDIINNYELDDISNKRELYGIIDYIIATQSNYFVGCDWSSFSISIKNNHINNGKTYNLLNIWDTCNKCSNDISENDQTNINPNY